MSNIALLLETRAAETPERKALAWCEGSDAKHWTYADLQVRVEGIAAGFRKHGLQPGDRALIFVPMSPELYVLLLGLWRAGGTAVFLDPWSTPRQMAAVCNSMNPQWFAGPPASALFLCRHRALRRIPHRIRIGKTPLFRSTPFHAFASDVPGPVEARTADDPALVTFTSGTTGVPKGANRTHGFLRAQNTALEHNLPVAESSVDLSHFPIFVLNSLASGRTAVIPPMDFRKPSAIDPTRMQTVIRDLDVHNLTGSPAFFDTLCALGDPLPAVKTAHTGGGPVGPRTLTAMRRAFPKAEISILYGSTEAEPISRIDAETFLNETTEPTRRGLGRCVGAPVGEIKLRLEADGEILVSGEHVCREYLGNPEANRLHKLREDDGTVWHRTGDIGRLDEQNRIWLLGRKGQFLQTASGQTLHTDAIAAAVETLPGVRRAACIVAQNLLWVGWEGEKSAKAEIQTLFAEHGWPLGPSRRLRQLPTDPRHNTKIDRVRLTRALGAPP
ncbi:MAG: AMP-binding protein [Verrucomicrobia bacterium]|nr:AMP-binding protein [Verrucomicrobiota bacterium]MCH8511582.1 AMP-binding protein [Kiritimatiellia bacterium]